MQNKFIDKLIATRQLSPNGYSCFCNELKNRNLTLETVTDKETEEIIAAIKSHSRYIMNEADRLRVLIKHWCPENLQYEGFPNTLVRAFLAATATCADYRRVLNGQDTIRSLESHPDPMVGFHNTPNGLADPAAPPVSAGNQWEAMRTILLRRIHEIEKITPAPADLSPEPRWLVQMLEAKHLLAENYL